VEIISPESGAAFGVVVFYLLEIIQKAFVAWNLF